MNIFNKNSAQIWVETQKKGYGINLATVLHITTVKFRNKSKKNIPIINDPLVKKIKSIFLVLFILNSDGKSHPLVGQTLTIAGRQYAVRSLLAEGGFALVFTVQDVLDGKWYALKRQLAIDQQSSDAVVKEVKFLKQVPMEIFTDFGHQAQNGLCFPKTLRI